MFSGRMLSRTSLRKTEAAFFCGGEVVERVIAAVFGCGSWYLACEVGYERECVFQKGDDVGGGQLTLNEEIIAGAASHRTPIYYFVFPFRIIPQIGGGEMLHCV